MITCEKCLYWEPPSEVKMGGLGECRRNPPQDKFWPVTLGTDWCGQVMPREMGSTQPVHEAAEQAVEAWNLWVTGRGVEALPKGLGLFDISMEELQEALRRMRP